MLLKIVRNRTSTIVLMYSLYLYFLVGLSLRNTSKALDIFDGEKRSILLFVIGFKNLVHAIYTKGKEYLHS
jgi:hypothetical protein